jgi:hypothetical protein
MLKVKTFGVEIRPMQTMNELSSLDEKVNAFIRDRRRSGTAKNGGEME